MTSTKPGRIARLFKSRPVVAVIRLSGAIGDSGRFSRGLSDASIAPLIERAAQTGRLKAIALAINSPGGSPVQSMLIAERIRDAALKRRVPVLAFCEDVAASGGYMLACAADEIYAETASIIGSIGVVSSSFGATEAIGKLGLERRLFTAGESKARLDPFQPLKAEDVEWLKKLQTQLHADFINRVKLARSDKLRHAPAEIFSGEVYLAEEARRYGLIDGIGRLRPVLEARFGEDVRIELVRPKRGWFGRASSGVSAAGSAEAIASAGAAGLMGEVETRALWSRFGL